MNPITRLCMRVFMAMLVISIALLNGTYAGNLRGPTAIVAPAATTIVMHDAPGVGVAAIPVLSAANLEAMADRRLFEQHFGDTDVLLETDEDHFHHRRLGRFHGGIVFPEEGVALPDELTAVSTSVPHGKVFHGTMGARFGGAQKCCRDEEYANAETYNWSSWTEGHAAIASGKEVVIPCGTHVILDQSPSGPMKGLRIEGSLTVPDEGADIKVDTGYVYNCGQLKANLQSGVTKLTFTLVGQEVGRDGFSTKAFVTQGGDLDLRGSMCNRTTWSTLAATADAGSQVLHLEDPVSWSVGTEVMVASTDFKGTQTEVVTVTSVSNNGRTLGINAGALVYPHAGVAPITAEVAALSRNIKITSEASCADIPNAEANNKPMCGHFVIDHTPRGVVCGVEITNMGKHTTTGKYPLHAHMCGDAPDLQIRSNAVHSNHHRALVIHGTSNATWAENVVFRSVGHLLLTEDGGEEGNKIVRNVLALPKKPVPGWPAQCKGIVASPYGGCEVKRCSHGTGIYEAVCGNRHDGETAAMWISNPANLIAHNRIIAGHNVGVRFETRGTTGRVALLSEEELKAFRVGANLKSQGKEEGLGGFVGNVIHSSRHGIFNYPSWNPNGGIEIKDYVAWKNGNAVFAKTKWAYSNPNLSDHRKYSVHNATLLMNKVQVYTIHDDSKLHVSASIIAPQLPEHLPLTAAASKDLIATGGACASVQATTMCSSHDYCTQGNGKIEDDSGDGGDGEQIPSADDTTVILRDDITNVNDCRALEPMGKWNKGVKNTFLDYIWKEAHPEADGTIEKPFGDWYFNLPNKKYKHKFGKSSLELNVRASCKEQVYTSTMKDGVVDPSYTYITDGTKCVGAKGSSPSVANRVSTPGVTSNSHQFDIFKAFREGKHSVEGLPWSITVDEETIAGMKANGYATWEELGTTGKDKRGVNNEILPRLNESPLACASHGCYLQAAGMQGHLGSYNKGYIHYGARKRHRHPIVFPSAEEVADMQSYGRHDACDGAWELVFRQTAPFKFNNENDWAEAKHYNVENPEADNYSVLDTLEMYRDEEGKFTLKLEYPENLYAFEYKKNGWEEKENAVKAQENLRVWRQTNDPTQRVTCINDGGRKRGANKNVPTEVVGNCGVEDFENLFPTEWVPLAGKWGGLEYNGGGAAFIEGSSKRRYGDSSNGVNAGLNWSVGSTQRWGPLAGDSKNVLITELYACNQDAEKPIEEEVEEEVELPSEEEDVGEDTIDDVVVPTEEEEEDGEWQLVFRQTAPLTYSMKDGWANALSMNEDNEHELMYSILGRLESFRDATKGNFRFKLRYPTAGLENIWEQTTNPAEVAMCKNNKGKPKKGNCGVEGYVPISIGTDEVAGGVGGVTAGFGGLEYNGNKALMDGSWGQFYYSIGSRSVVRNNLGMKLFQTYAPGAGERVAELYAYVGSSDTAMA